MESLLTGGAGSLAGRPGDLEGRHDSALLGIGLRGVPNALAIAASLDWGEPEGPPA